MFEQIQEMLADYFSIPASKITLDSDLVKDLGADSIDTIELLNTLEEEYGIRIPDEDMGMDGEVKLRTVRDIVAEIEKLKN